MLEQGIRILGLREGGDAFLDRNLLVPSLKEAVTNSEQVLSNIPLEERYNLFYTVGIVSRSDRKTMVVQKWLPFDIDGVQTYEDKDTYIGLFLSVIGIERKDITIIHSGNGVHLLVALKSPISTPDYFKLFRVKYKWLCEKINTKFINAGLLGKMDPAVFSPSRLMRLPGTINKKKNKPDTKCVFIQYGSTPIDWDWDKILGLPEISEEDIYPDAMGRFGPADKDAVLNGCEFLKHCKSNATTISEPEWFAMLGILYYLPDGRSLCHEYSKPYQKYDKDETDRKISHIEESTGPRKCGSIDPLWGGCTGCPNYKVVTTPVAIRGEAYVASESNSFHIIDSSSGKEKISIAYDDIRKAITREYLYKTMAETETVYKFTGTCYIPILDTSIKAIINSMLVRPTRTGRVFDPPKKNLLLDAVDVIKRYNHTPAKMFNEYSTISKSLNFINGVLDYEKIVLRDRLPEDLFLSVLPFEYDPSAECPVFRNFLRTSIGDDETINMVLEFIASGLFEVPSFIIQRFLLLQGKGSNGKSVLIKLIEDIVGRDACSFIVPGSDISTHDMNTIVFKKFNLIEEGDMSKKLLSSIKSLVSGGAFNSSEKFKSPITIQCNTKFVVAINNEVPEYGMDNSHARRMLQVKMTNTFDRNHPDFDPHLQEKLRGELSGIFNLILGSYINLKNRGFKIIEAQQSIEEKNDIMAISDDVYGFSLDCLEIQPNHKFRAKLLWECYRTWCADQGIKYAKTNTLFAKIFKNHPDIKSLFNFTKGEDKHGVFYLGIGLKPKQDDYDI